MQHLLRRFRALKWPSQREKVVKCGTATYHDLANVGLLPLTLPTASLSVLMRYMDLPRVCRYIARKDEFIGTLMNNLYMRSTLEEPYTDMGANE